MFGGGAKAAIAHHFQGGPHRFPVRNASGGAVKGLFPVKNTPFPKSSHMDMPQFLKNRSINIHTWVRVPARED